MVIAIIAILAAILFPVFAQAREKARQIACVSNNKQMALAVMQYANDYDETLPTIGDLGEERGRWMWQILPYVKNLDVYTCPNLPNNTFNGTRYAAAVIPGRPGSTATGYGWNLNLNCAAGLESSNQCGPNAQGYALARIAKPAATIIIGDTGFDKVHGFKMFARDPQFAPASHIAPGYWPQFRHHATRTKPVQDSQNNVTRQMPLEGLCSFVFLDGHAKALGRGTAFEKAPNRVEDGQTLTDGEAGSAGGANPPPNPNTEYVLWNIH